MNHRELTERAAAGLRRIKVAPEAFLWLVDDFGPDAPTHICGIPVILGASLVDCQRSSAIVPSPVAPLGIDAEDRARFQDAFEDLVLEPRNRTNGTKAKQRGVAPTKGW